MFNRFHDTSLLAYYQFTRKGIAQTFQNIRLFGAASVLENLTIAMEADTHYTLADTLLRTPCFRKQEEQFVERAKELLVFFELDKKADFMAKNLPYGEQRRLEIARDMATHPKVLCLDEPAAGMNPSEVDDLVGMIQKIRQAHDVTILLIEHHMSMVMAIADRIKVIEFGITIAEGKPDEIKNDPRLSRPTSARRKRYARSQPSDRTVSARRLISHCPRRIQRDAAGAGDGV